MASPSPFPSPMDLLVQRSSTGLSLGTYRKSESKAPLSDSSTKGPYLEVGTFPQPEITPHRVVSPAAESPAREAEASQPSPVVAPPPLGATPVSHPQEPPTGVLADSPKTHGPSQPVLERASEQPGPVPFVIQMITDILARIGNSGEDVDAIIHSVLGDNVQISIDAIDRVCSTFAPRHETRKLTAVLTRFVN